MSDDIEAAARALLTNGEGREFKYLVLRDTPGNLPGEGGSYSMAGLVSTLRSALAHAARGEGEERPVHRDDEWWIRRINEAHKHGGLPWLVTVAKNFPRDEGASPTPPPATGEAERCEDHGREGCIDCEPATGEAGTRGEVERVRAAVIDAAKAFRAHDETYLIANYENVAEEGERQRLIVKMLVAVDALLAAERSENGGDRG